MYHAPHGATPQVYESLQAQTTKNPIERYVMAETNMLARKHVYALLKVEKPMSLPQGMQTLRLEGLSSVVTPCMEASKMLRYLVKCGVKKANIDLSDLIMRHAKKQGRYVDLTESECRAIVPVNTPMRNTKRAYASTPMAPKKRSRSAGTDSDDNTTTMSDF